MRLLAQSPTGAPNIPTPDQRRAREQLGLPTAGLVIMSGHQSEFWHPGILAKYFAIIGAATRIAGAHPVWVVVDQDTNDPSAIAYPRRTKTGGLARGTWQIPVGNSGRPSPETPTAQLATLQTPRDINHLISELQPANEDVGRGIQQIASTLNRAAQSSSAASQVAAAVQDVLTGVAPPPAPSLLFATRLTATDVFAAWVQHMRDDARACARAYNGAAVAFPHSRIRPLELTEDRCELPLWRVSAGRRRERVFSHTLADTPIATLAPRALLMTALLRAAACDLFVHGLGGGVYDQVTERWMQAWQPRTTLAPTAVVTATRLLQFDGDPPPAPQEIANAAWLAHRARHDPAVLGDSAGAERKQTLVEAIAASKQEGQDPRSLYRELHNLLEATREDHAAAIKELVDWAQLLRKRRVEAQVAFERTWPFPLYDPEQLRQLCDEVVGAFTGGNKV